MQFVIKQLLATWLIFFVKLCICLLANVFRTSKRAKKRDLEGQHSKNQDDKKDSGEVQNKRRRGRGGNVTEREPQQIAKLDVKITIPRDLRRFLLDDADFVTRQKQLVPLPKSEDKCVKAVLNDYIACKRKSLNDAKISTCEEVIKGISEYFDVVLGTQLLYKFERPQYADLLKNYPNKTMSEVYGSEHLLRLFVKMGGMLSYGNLDDKSMHFIVSQIQDFLEWMTKGSDEKFSCEYEAATPEYYRRAAT